MNAILEGESCISQIRFWQQEKSRPLFLKNQNMPELFGLNPKLL